MTKSLKAYVLSGAGDDDVKVWLRDFADAEIVTRLEDANLVVFTGGADVTPSLYGEKNVAASCDWLRDSAEMEVFDFCKFVGMPMFGICRGSQFLHTAMDGKLWQDVTNHCCTHDLIDVESGAVVKDTCSTHHQMVRMSWTCFDNPTEAGFTLIAMPDTNRSKHYVSEAGVLRSDEEPVVEVEAYRYERNGTSIMAIQGHPEWSSDEFATWAGGRVAAWHLSLGAAPDIQAFGTEPRKIVDAGGGEVFDRAAYKASIAGAGFNGA